MLCSTTNCTAMSIYATLDKDLDQTRSWFKLRKLRKDGNTIEEVMRVKIDALNVDFFVSPNNGKTYASVHGEVPQCGENEWLQVSN